MKQVAIFGNGHCARAKIYQREIQSRDISFDFFDIDADDAARAVLASFYADHIAKAPALIIGGKLFRNPRIVDLDKILTRAGVYDAGLIHDEVNQRYIRHMTPKDAFVSYTWRGSTKILTHIEVPTEKRGRGVGARFAAEVFDAVLPLDIKTRLTCPFLKKVAQTEERWCKHFCAVES